MTQRPAHNTPTSTALSEIALLLGRSVPTPDVDLLLSSDEMDLLQHAGEKLSDDARRLINEGLVIDISTERSPFRLRSDFEMSRFAAGEAKDFGASADASSEDVRRRRTVVSTSPAESSDQQARRERSEAAAQAAAARALVRLRERTGRPISDKVRELASHAK